MAKKQKPPEQLFRIVADSEIYAWTFEVPENVVLKVLTTIKNNFLELSRIPEYSQYDAYLKVTITKL